MKLKGILCIALSGVAMKRNFFLFYASSVYTVFVLGCRLWG